MNTKRKSERKASVLRRVIRPDGVSGDYGLSFPIIRQC